MESFSKKLSLRWSDLDPNFHVRHSVYYDFGAQIRVEFLEEVGMGLKYMQKHGFGPVLFREECIFKKEIRNSDDVSITVKLLRLRSDYARFSIGHDIISADGTVHATLTVDGAWMDVKERKLTIPPADALQLISSFPKADSFEFYDKEAR
jgi:acyl-CoA thioester hydrolase